MSKTITALALLCLVMAPATGQAAERKPPAGPVILTISGAVAHHNRGPVDPVRDRFFVYQEKSFERAFAFDLEMLMSLKQVEISAKAKDWPSATAITGPLLSDVLQLAGADGTTVTFYALDGFAAELTADELGAHDWVLGLRADGRPLGLGDKGPVWLAYDTSVLTALPAGADTKWVWSVFHIDVTK